MSMYSPSIEKLIESFEKLPSIGNKTAARLAFYILNASQEETDEFVNAIVNAKSQLVKKIEVVDTYNDGEAKSITTRITFSHPEKTLTREEVMDIVNTVIDKLEADGIKLKK